MKQTVFKGVVDRTAQYRRMMCLMGKCLAQGGTADMRAYTGKRTKARTNAFGRILRVDELEDVTLFDLTLDWSTEAAHGS